MQPVSLVWCTNKSLKYWALHLSFSVLTKHFFKKIEIGHLHDLSYVFPQYRTDLLHITSDCEDELTCNTVPFTRPLLTPCFTFPLGPMGGLIIIQRNRLGRRRTSEGLAMIYAVD